MSSNFVMIPRELLDNLRYRRSSYVHILVHLWLKAKYAPDPSTFNGEPVILQRGQCVTGRDTISRETGIHPSTVKRELKWLELDQQISIRSCRTSSLITVINYDCDRHEKRPSDQQTANQRPATDQPSTTYINREAKSETETGNILYAPPTHSTSGSDGGNPDAKSVARHAAEIGVAPAVASEFHAYYEKHHWQTKNGTPIRNWKVALSSWDKRQKERDAAQKAATSVSATTPQVVATADTTTPQVAAEVAAKVETKPASQVPATVADEDDDGDDEYDKHIEAVLEDRKKNGPYDSALVYGKYIPTRDESRASRPSDGALIEPRFGAYMVDRKCTSYPTTIDKGIFIRYVRPNTPAFEAGLLTDDILLKVNGIEISDNDHFVEVAARYRRKPLALNILRDGQTIEKEVLLGQS